MDTEDDRGGGVKPDDGIDRFLLRLRQCDGNDVAGGDWDRFAHALHHDPQALKEALETNGRHEAQGPGFIHSQMFASAACDREGRVVVADDAFAKICSASQAGTYVDLGPLRGGQPRISFLMHPGGDCTAVAAAGYRYAAIWPLAENVRSVVRSGKAAYAVIANLSARVGKTSLVAADVFRLTPHETRVLFALIRCGQIPQAAQQCAISYETARDAIKAVMRKSGVSSQAALISLCMALQAGQLPPSRHLEDVLRDMFGLSARQARVAVLAAQGQPRPDIAQVMAVSEHVVKSELKIIYAALRVGSVGALSQMVSDIRALKAVSDAHDLTPVSPFRAEPLRLIPRAGRAGRVAISDHGPMDGVPVIMLHTATTGRHNPLTYIRALQSHGIRPIAIDRPGYGLSDMVDGDYLSGSADDLRDVLDALGLYSAVVLARGGTVVLHRFIERYPKRLIRAVVINPEPAPLADRKLNGVGGYAKRLVYKHPALINGFARHLSTRASASIVEGLIRRTLEASAADRALLDDADFMRAYVRSTQHCALQGGAGFIAVARDEPRADLVPLRDGSRITILCGREDPLYGADDSVPRWQALWPGAGAYGVEGAGRLLAYHKPDLVAAALKGQSLTTPQSGADILKF